MRLALLLLALILTGIQIPEPTEGVIVSKSSMAPYSIVGRAREDCGYWDACAAKPVRMPGFYIVRFRWELLGKTGVSECHVDPGVHWRAEIGQTFRCEA